MKKRANYRMYTICGFGLTTTDVNSGDAHICTVPCMVVLAHIKQSPQDELNIYLL